MDLLEEKIENIGFVIYIILKHHTQSLVWKEKVVLTICEERVGGERKTMVDNDGK